jgi:hypothetical protein
MDLSDLRFVLGLRAIWSAHTIKSADFNTSTTGRAKDLLPQTS